MTNGTIFYEIKSMIIVTERAVLCKPVGGLGAMATSISCDDLGTKAGQSFLRQSLLIWIKLNIFDPGHILKYKK